jgi:hypothetical protein
MAFCFHYGVSFLPHFPSAYRKSSGKRRYAEGNVEKRIRRHENENAMAYTERLEKIDFFFTWAL